MEGSKKKKGGGGEDKRGKQSMRKKGRKMWRKEWMPIAYYERRKTRNSGKVEVEG